MTVRTDYLAFSHDRGSLAAGPPGWRLGGLMIGGEVVVSSRPGGWVSAAGRSSGLTLPAGLSSMASVVAGDV